MLLLGLLFYWNWENHLVMGASDARFVHGPGLLFSTAIMIIVARVILKTEAALREPWDYRWDILRAVRWYLVLVAMAVSIRFLG